MKHTIKDVETVNPEFRMYHGRLGLFNSHFQNFKQFGVPKAQLILTDIPYNVGNKAYGSNPMWYVGGDNKNGESELAGETFFDTDKLAEFSRILGRNFFYVYCTVESSMLNESDSLLVIENARLKEELSTAKKEIARLRCTV